MIPFASQQHHPGEGAGQEREPETATRTQSIIKTSAFRSAGPVGQHVGDEVAEHDGSALSWNDARCGWWSRPTALDHRALGHQSRSLAQARLRPRSR